jgi:hypothetical protein
VFSQFSFFVVVCVSKIMTEADQHPVVFVGHADDMFSALEASIMELDCHIEQKQYHYLLRAIVCLESC